MKRLLSIGLLATLAALAGCEARSQQNAQVLRVGLGGIKLGGTFRFNEVEAPRSLDPARVGDTTSHHIANQVFQGLVEFNDDLKIVPALAESWDVSADSTTYSFRLRKGVPFHDSPAFPGGTGREMVASDVKYSWERLADPYWQTMGWWVFSGKIVGLDDLRARIEKERERITQAEGLAANDKFDPWAAGLHCDGIRVIDPFTVEVQLVEPFAPFLGLLCLSYPYVVPREAVLHFGKDIESHPVGTGPFQFLEWVPNQRIVLERNPRYWEKDPHGNPLPYLDRIHITARAESAAETQEFLKGYLHMHQPIDTTWRERLFQLPTTQLKEEFATKGYKVQMVPRLGCDYYGFYLDQVKGGHLDPNPLMDRRVRLAFNYAIDRQSIVEKILKGFADVCESGPIPPGCPSDPADKHDGYRYDLVRAKQLMAEAGFPDGKNFPPITLRLNKGGAVNEEVAVVIQAMLKTIGVTANMQLADWAQHLDAVEHGESEFFRMGWILDYPDAENILSLFHSKKLSPDGSNTTHYKNPDFDRLFEEATRTLDDAKRHELYRQAERLVIDDAPWLFILYSWWTRLVQPEVRGLRLNDMDVRIYKHVWLDLPVQEPVAARAGN